MLRNVLIALTVFAVGVAGAIAAAPLTNPGDYRINPNAIAEDYTPIQQYGTFHGKYVTPPHDAPVAPPHDDVLGASTNPDKRIEVDLTNQRLYAFEGDRKIYDFPVSTGLWGRTPTGEFRIWIKLRYTRMTGGNKAWGTYYDLPNVPYTMFFANDEVPAWRGFGIHGAYWHNNFGHPMSHGCVNMKEEDVAKIYYWADPDLMGKTSIRSTDDNQGTRVIIYGTAPEE